MSQIKHKYRNHSYAFVFYDVKEQRVNKVLKICKKYFTHFQNSVFRGDTTPSNLLRFKNEILKIIDREEDSVCIIKMAGKTFDEDSLGAEREGRGESFII